MQIISPKRKEQKYHYKCGRQLNIVIDALNSRLMKKIIKKIN